LDENFLTKKRFSHNISTAINFVWVTAPLLPLGHSCEHR